MEHQKIVINRKTLVEHIARKGSCLCVGLDTDLSKIPPHLLDCEDPVFSFNKAIIDATAEHCVAFKPNFAFYEVLGVNGWMSLEKTIGYIKECYPHHLVIADAKRGDIGNTSAMYAKSVFETLNADAITLAPYMGEDSLCEFIKYEHKWSIVLALTSNKGANDFQHLELWDDPDTTLHQKVIETVADWGSPRNLMFVVGATQTKYLQHIREIIPEHFLLVPGVGKQGGNLEEVFMYGMNGECGLIINSSREIIYASNERDFAKAAAAKAKETSDKMRPFIEGLKL